MNLYLAFGVYVDANALRRPKIGVLMIPQQSETQALIGNQAIKSYKQESNIKGI